MQRSFYLVVTAKYNRYNNSPNDFSVRIVANKPALSNNEIAVLLKLDVPKEFFERMIPVAELNLPKDAILNLDAATIVALSAPDLAQKLQISLEDAEDGLKQMLSKRNENTIADPTSE